MSTNSQEIVQQIRSEFEAMLTNLLNNCKEQTPTADAIERGLWKQILKLGCSCMALFLVKQAETVTPESVTTPEAGRLPYHDDKERSYHCAFGEIRFARRYYYRPGTGVFPLDAALNLPTNACSDMVREWQERLGAFMSYHQADDILEEMLGRPFSSRALSEAVQTDAAQVQAFYQEGTPRLPDPQATILVVQADGKGVPMVMEPTQPAPVRRGKGQKPCRKKEAIVTSVYTLAPTPRTPQSVADSLLHDNKEKEPETRPKPHNKWLWATLSGKEAALAFTAGQVALQDGPHILHRVALTDGAEALQTRTQAQFPDFTLVLDFLHADEYLWNSANALLGETAPERTAWVKARTLQMLSGQTSTVIAEFRQLASLPQTSPEAQKTLLSVASYYERNLAFMAYDRYLAWGWPIATGVIEGACRHLVKDRCELSGMRWTQAGAEALLRLRSVAENGDWANFHAFRRRVRQEQVYGYWQVAPQTPPAVTLKLAA